MVQQLNCARVPAPMSGITAVDSLSEMSPTDAIYSYNMVPGQYGLRVRDGTTEWCTTVGSGGVRTILPYTASVTSGDKLFAAAQNGIYDITASSTTPTLLIAFPATTLNSGYGTCLSFTTIGDKFLVYCDEEYGYYLYTESTATWARVTNVQVTGVNPNNLVQCWAWKNRIWFVEKNSGNAWYLPVGAIIGAATSFAFGNKFRAGGSLVAGFTMTMDGGEGIDDYLVAVSGAGDVIVYKGTDPSVAADIDIKGQWYIGSVPAGRRCGMLFGGDLYLLSSYGIIPVSQLMAGQIVQKESTEISRRISPLINAQMSLYRNQRGWEMRIVPSSNLLLVAVPTQTGLDPIQFVQSLNNQAWGIFRKIPYLTGDVWNGVFYFGTSDNRVLKYTGAQDEVKLNGTPGVDIEFSFLGSYSDLEAPGQYKQVEMLQAIFVGGKLPSYTAKAVYDYQLNEIVNSTSPTAGGDVWDSGKWDSAIWSDDFFVVSKKITGNAGMGRRVAVAIRGSSSAPTALVEILEYFKLAKMMM